MQKHINVKIHGKVQGVFFRYSTKEFCEENKITGFATNLDDGTVYLEAEGTQETLDKLRKWCKNGPDMAEVDKIEVNNGTLKNYNTFTIK